MPHRTIHQCIDTTVSLVKLALAVRLYKDAIVSFVCLCVCVHIKGEGGGVQGAKKVIFTASHSGKLKLAFTSPDIISTSPKSFLTSRIDFTVLSSFKFHKKHHLIVIFYGLVHKINSIAWKRWLLWNTWILQWLEKRRIFMSQTWAKLQWWG